VRIEQARIADPLPATRVVQQLLDRIGIEGLSCSDRVDPEVPPDPAQRPADRVVECRLRRIKARVRSVQLKART